MSRSATNRDAGLLPAPVRTASTEMTGTEHVMAVLSGPSREKSAPAASTREAWCITNSWETSL